MKQLICVLLFFVLLFPYMAIWDLLKQAPIAAIGRAIQSWNQPQQQQATPTTSTQGFASGLSGGTVGGGGGGGGGGTLVKNAQGQLVPASSSGGGGGGGGGGSWNNGGGGDTELQMLEKMDRNPIQERRYQELRGYQAPRPAPQAPQAPAVPQKPQTFDMGSFQRKISDMASSVGQKASSTLGSAGNAIASGGGKMLGAIGRAITPSVYAGEGNEKTPESWKTKLGKGLENLGTMFGAPELKWSEGLAGGATPLTGQTESSARVFSPYRYTPEERVGATSEKTGLGFTPGEAPQLTGMQTLGRTPPPLGVGGGGAGSVLGLSDFTFASLVDEIMSPSSFAQVAQMPMEDLDAAYTQMANELGVTKQQAVLNDLNTQVLEVTDSLESIDKDVTEESGDVLMTEGQRRRLVESRSRPLREQLIKLMRSAQYAGVGLDNLMGMLKDRMGAKQQTVTNQFQASQQAQSAEEERKRRLMGLLPYVQPKAKTLSSGGGGGGGDMTLESLLG